jgi:5'-nucleotidase
MTRALFLIALFLLLNFYSEAVKVTVFHTTDMHGHVFPFRDSKTGKKIGSYGSIITILNEYRKNDRPFLMLDAGDIFQGTLDDRKTRGDIIARVIGDPMVGYDARCFGNHEFDYGYQILRDRASHSRFPWLAANVSTEMKGVLDFKKDYVIIEKAGIKFGIFGLTTTDTPKNIFPGLVDGIRFDDELNYVKPMAKKLRKLGADFVILLGHLGFYVEEAKKGETNYVPLRPKLLDAVLKQDDNDPEAHIDLVIDGHSHEVFFKEFEEDKTTKKDNLYISQSGKYARYLGALELDIDESQMMIRKATPKFHLLDAEVFPPNQKFLTKYRSDWIASLKESRQKIARVQLGFKLEHDLKNSWQKDPAALFVARAFYEYAKAKGHNVALSLVNNHGIRNSINSLAGKITREGVHQVCPFQNDLVVLDLTGDEILKILGNSGRYLTIFGGKAEVYKEEYEDNQPGMNVHKLWIDKGNEQLVPLDKNKTYKVVAQNFLAQSKNYLIWKLKENEIEIGGIDQDSIKWMLKQDESIITKDGKLRVTDYDWISTKTLKIK